MDSARKSRSRTKALSPEDASSQNDSSITDTVATTAADVNGEEVQIEKPDEADAKPEDKPTAKSSESQDEKSDDKADSKDKPVKSRKRKASEMKSGDDSVVGDPPKMAKEKESDVDKTKDSVVNSSVDKENVNDETDEKKESTKVEKNKTDKGGTKVADVEMKNVDKVESPPAVDQVDPEDLAKQTLGKGKRARIPNKRYSDIVVTPSGKSNKSFVENGDKSNLEKIESEDDSMIPAMSFLKSRSSAGSPFAKKPKLSIDLSNPNFLKPFKLGWRRELVYRATNDSATKRNGDIYYYTPAGKKVRSMREVSEHLDGKSELKLEDFTFFKEPLGLDDPEKEIIRDAKIKMGGTTATSVVKKVPPLTPKPQLVKTPKAKPSVTPKTPVAKMEPKAASTPASTSKTTPKTPAASAKTPAKPAALSPKRLTSPKVINSPPHVSSENSVETPTAIKPKTSAKLGNFKIKPPSAKKVDKKMKTEETIEAEAGPSKWSAKKTGKWSNSDSKPCQPCSIRCPAMMGMVPTLQCRLCLCLYHHECVGMPQDCEAQNYVCKNCFLDQDPTGITTQPAETPVASPSETQPPPPPLTPINSLKSQSQIKSVVITPAVTLPKLQRIPRPGEAPVQPVHSPRRVQSPHEMPRLVPRPAPAKLVAAPAKLVKVSEALPPAIETKSLVGSVTTWLPQNSKIQVDSPMMNPGSLTMTESPRPQFVEYLAGRKFLIIPKHNIVSVSPTVAITPASRPEDIVNIPESNKTPVDSASLGLKDVCDIKPEPESPSKPENTQTEAMDVDPTEQDVVVGRPQSVDVDETEKDTPMKAPPKKRMALTRTSSTLSNIEKKLDDSKFMDNYLQHLAYGYNTLLYVFQYLKVQDLLKAGCVCTMWRDVASHPLLWRTVRLKNSTVRCFKGLANTLEKHGTVHLDLRKMILPNTQADLMWPDFNEHISKVTTLRKIELCRCPAKVVEDLAISNPQLEIVNAVAIKCEAISLDNMANFTGLKELRLKSVSGFSQTSNLDALKQLKSLRHLSLTSVRDLNKLNLSVIAELKNLDSLDLGECMDFPKNFGTDILLKLPKLEKLRLEKGQSDCHTFEILDAVKDLKKLEQLELVNFDIKPGFDKALGNCTNIKRLLIIPTYISQSATTNHMVLGGVLRLQKTLSHFVWGVTLELLRVTELFVDQCEEPEKKEKKDKERERKATVNGDSIPVLKPVPLISERDSVIQPAYDPPQVEILPLPNLQKLLLQSLPTTRVKILKIPFHATWRQSITDSVN